jgi:prepilin-type N-terminal cleavage/methylation domain-containing protein
MFKKTMRRGFTLIEMLIVMAVVSILIAIIIPSYRGMQNDAWIAKAEKEAQTIQAAVESYYRHHNEYPAGLDALLAAKPTIINKMLEDPWKTDETNSSYGYLTGTLSGFGAYYIIYSRSIDGVDDVKTAAASLTRDNPKLIIPAGSDDIVLTNLPLEKQK